MLENLNILKMASAMARYASERHQVLSQNIANADTSDYRAKDLEPFADAYARFDAAKSSGDQTATSSNGSGSFAKLVDMPGVETPNGNNVSLEEQLVRTGEAQANHETATVLYKKTLDMLRLTLNSGA